MLARAFQDDPAWSWVAPGRRAGVRRCCRWLFRLGFELIEAELWTTPERDARLRALAAAGPAGRRMSAPMLRALVATPLRLREATSRFLAYGRAVETCARIAVPVPHWYLAGIGVEPAEQRRGIGSALMAPGLEAAERDGVPCALLTNSEQNLAFYEAHGFVVVLEGETPARRPARLDDGAPRRLAPPSL